MAAIKKQLVYISAFVIVIIASGGSLSASEGPAEIKFKKEILNNGLTVIYMADNTFPEVLTLMHYNVGSMDEKAGKTGTTNFIKEFMFRRTGNIEPGDIKHYIRDVAGSMGEGISWEESYTWFRVPSDQLPLPLWIESERMSNLAFDDSDIEIVRKKLLQEIESKNNTEPYIKLHFNISKIIFDTWPVTGFEDHIKKLNKQSLEEFYKLYYKPANATLVIAGDFDIGVARGLVDKYFDGIAAGAPPEKMNFLLPKLSENYSKTINDPNISNRTLFTCYRGVAVDDSSYYPLILLGNILANGRAARLTEKLVYDEEIASGVNLNSISLRNTGALYLKSVLKEDADIDDVQEAYQNVLKGLIKNGVSDEELELAKQMAANKMIAEYTDPLQKALALSRYNAWFGNPERINDIYREIEKVTAKDIINAAKRLLDTDRKAIFIFEPESI